jgi:hypothetical protein
LKIEKEKSGERNMHSKLSRHRCQLVLCHLQDRWRRLVEVIFWVAFVWVVSLDVIQIRLARRQGYSTYAYFKHNWNLFTWLTNTALLLWLIVYLWLYGR